MDGGRQAPFLFLYGEILMNNKRKYAASACSFGGQLLSHAHKAEDSHAQQK